MLNNCSDTLLLEDFHQIEKEIGKTIPDQMKEYYLKYNGGTPSKPYCYVESIEDFVEISSFMPFKYHTNDKWSIEYCYTFQSKKGVIFDFLLPFARDWGGNYFAVDLRSGEVVYLYMDMGQLTGEMINLVANNFEEFIQNLAETND